MQHEVDDEVPVEDKVVDDELLLVLARFVDVELSDERVMDEVLEMLLVVVQDNDIEVDEAKVDEVLVEQVCRSCLPSSDVRIVLVENVLMLCVWLSCSS